MLMDWFATVAGETSAQGGGSPQPQKMMVGLTAHTLSCAARARVPKPTRRAACLHVSRAMQAA
jgi:hypothetical protein